MPSGVRVWEVLSVLDGGHGRFTQRALLHRTPTHTARGQALLAGGWRTKPPPHSCTLSSSAFRSKGGVVLRRRSMLVMCCCWGEGLRSRRRALGTAAARCCVGVGADAGGRRRAAGRLVVGRRGAWQHVPTHTSVSMPIARSLRVVRCHLSLGSRRHPVESGHAPADRSATWLRFRGGSFSLPITLQRATASLVHSEGPSPPTLHGGRVGRLPR